MKKQLASFTHIKGEQAYEILCDKTFNNFISIRSLKWLYENFELIMFENKQIVAFRYDYPESLKEIISTVGEWKEYDERSFSTAIWLNNVLKVYEGFC
jgi:hypothetical protein